MLSDHPSTGSSTNHTLTTGGTHTHHTHGTSYSNSTNGNHSHSHHGHSHHGPEHPNDHPYLMLSLKSSPGDAQPHTHHSHGTTSSSSSTKPCCGAPPLLQRPILTLKKPAVDIVRESTPYDLYHLLLQIIRMGPYELFVEFIEAWRTQYSNTTTSSTSSSTSSTPPLPPPFDRMIHAYDANGHTLTHWAAKRTDDIRILQYLLYQVHSNHETTTAVTIDASSPQSSQYLWNSDTKDLVSFQFDLPLVTESSMASTDGTTQTAAATALFPTPIHRPTHDNTRMTPLHWACTQENGLSIIKVLLDASILLMMPGGGGGVGTVKGGGSSPIHSTLTSTTTIPSILEIRDGTGCTPCLIASQHGRVETVAYLIQRGANIYAVDTARDSMIHWAAYKGSEQVLGLISYYCSDQQFYTPDAYGQTPLHLASLRGHVSVVRYILHHLLQQPLAQQHQSGGGHNNNNSSSSSVNHHPNAFVNVLQHQQQSMKQRMVTIRAVRDLLALKDQNGRTPYELAIHKNKPAVAAELKSQMLTIQRMLHPSLWESQIRQYLSMETLKQLCLLRTWKTWLGLPEVDDLDESPRFPFYYVIGQVVCHVFFTFGIFIPLFDISKGVLWDYMIMLMINSILIVISAYSLYQCHTTNPGRLDSTFINLSYWRRLYEQTLDAFASSDEGIAKQAATVPLCHTCHIARPPRSKHDRFSRSCILQFDHHCPFVGTTIGLYNYKWFFMFILAISIYFINFWILLFVHFTRTSSTDQKSIFTLIFGIYLGLHILFSGGMVIYHAQLIWANLTTNEHIHLARYDYLWDTSTSSRRIFANPWNKGCLNNMYDRFILPGDHCYLVPTADPHESRTSASSSIELHQPLVKRMVETV